MLDLATARAIYVFAADYHSGQWSRGYRLGCVAGRWLERHNVHNPMLPLSATASEVYFALLRNGYADKL